MSLIKRPRQQTASAAALAVGAELSRRGYDVAFTLGNTRKVDLLCSVPGGSAFKIQVKGISNKAPFWVQKSFFDPPEETNLFLIVVLVPKVDASPFQFFVLTHRQAMDEFKKLPKTTKSGRPFTDEEAGLYWSSVTPHEKRWDQLPPVAAAESD